MEMDPTYPEKLREQLRRLLLDYSFEQIMEIGGVEEIDALEDVHGDVVGLCAIRV